MGLGNIVRKHWNNMWGSHTPPEISTPINISQPIQFFEVNGQVLWRKGDTQANLRELYQKAAPLSSIINRSAEALASGNLEVLNASTDNYVRGKYKEWEQLLNNPNPLQSKRQYFRQQYTYTQINGWSLALVVKSVGFDVPSQLWPLPFWLIEVDEKKSPLFTMTKEDLLQGIYLNYGGKKVPLPADSLILFTDDTGDIDEKTWLPKSRLLQLEYPLTTLLSAEEAEVTMIQRKGAIGIFSNEDNDTMGKVNMSENEIQELQSQYSRYGLSRDQWQVIITNANLKWQSTTFPTKDLLLQESYVKSYKMLCDAFKYPFELTAMSERKNLANVNSFDTILYQNKILPEADAFTEQLMMGLNAQKNNIKIRFDFSHIPALQKSEEEKGKGRKAMNEGLQMEWDNNLITLNMWLKEIGRDEVKEERFNKYKCDLTAEELGMIELTMEQNQNNGDKTDKDK